MGPTHVMLVECCKVLKENFDRKNDQDVVLMETIQRSFITDGCVRLI